MKGSGGCPGKTVEEMNTLFLEKLYTLEDVKEGIASFEEKRRPEWKHR